MVYFAGSAEMERLDKLAVDNGLEIRQMMELAGWHMVNLFRRLKISKEGRVVVICGKGNKAGDGLCAARHLVNHGWGVKVILAANDLKLDPDHHLKLLKKMNVSLFDYSNNQTKCKRLIGESEVLVDALIGYHLNGAPRGDFAELIELMNGSGKRIISYDLPTGVDATTGECFQPCIKAHETLTLALPKELFKKQGGKDQSGKVYLADIGIPSWLYDQISPGSRPDFGEGKDSLVEI